MTKDTYPKSRTRLEEIISVTGVGASIRIRKDDLLAVLSRLDEAESAISEALAATDSVGDQLIWDSAEAHDILEAALRGSDQ